MPKLELQSVTVPLQRSDSKFAKIWAKRVLKSLRLRFHPEINSLCTIHEKTHREILFYRACRLNFMWCLLRKMARWQSWLLESLLCIICSNSKYNTLICGILVCIALLFVSKICFALQHLCSHTLALVDLRTSLATTWDGCRLTLLRLLSFCIRMNEIAAIMKLQCDSLRWFIGSIQ